MILKVKLGGGGDCYMIVKPVTAIAIGYSLEFLHNKKIDSVTDLATMRFKFRMACCTHAQIKFLLLTKISRAGKEVTQ